MKNKIGAVMALAFITSMSYAQVSVSDVIKRLQSIECYRAEALMEMSMPQQGVDVAYEIDMMSMPSTAPDSVKELCDYLIEWNVPEVEGVEKRAFSTSFAGHSYSYRGERLQHRVGGGNLSQFAMFLPQYIAAEIKAALDDNDCLVEVTENGDELLVNVVETMGREEARNASYRLAREGYLPLSASIVNNPGGVGEQQFEISYGRIAENGVGDCKGLTMEYVSGIYPEVFTIYGCEDFEIGNLTGLRFPSFSLPTLDGERCAHLMKEGFLSPTYIVFLSVEHDDTQDVISHVRQAARQVSIPVEIIWAFVDGNHDDIAGIVPMVNARETIVMNADRLAGECGATQLPVTIVADEEGLVKYVSVGHNKGLETILIQKTEL